MTMSATSVSAVMPITELTKTAAYGKLPFDRYVLAHWVHSRPGEEDQKQWNELARKWLQMDHTARNPYWEAAQPLCDTEANDPRMPTREQINRVLAPHQTAAERNLATEVNDCVWVRTCYELSLAPAFEAMSRDIRKDAYESYRLFDNQALYGDIGHDLAGLFLRMPQLPDTIGYCGYPETEDEPFDDELPEDEGKSRLYNAVSKERFVMYLMDEEALKQKMLKLIWTDLGGNIVWWNWLDPSHTMTFEGHLYGLGHRLHWLLELGDGNSYYDEEGAVIDFS